MVILVARARNGAEIERHELPVDNYYEDLHQIIDSDEYRAKRGIVTLEGQLFDSAGKLSQEFWNRYAADGSYEGGRTVHADGTVNED